MEFIERFRRNPGKLLLASWVTTLSLLGTIWTMIVGDKTLAESLGGREWNAVALRAVVGLLLFVSAFVTIVETVRMPAVRRRLGTFRTTNSMTYAIVAIIGALLGVGIWSFLDSVSESKSPEAPGPILPRIVVATLPGLSIAPGHPITGELADFREHSLMLKNPNSVDVRHFSARLQLPERALRVTPAFIGSRLYAPQGVNVRWFPEPHQAVGMASGAGASVQVIEGDAKAEWRLEIDSFPAFTEVRIPFVTMKSEEWMSPSPDLFPERASSKPRLAYYLDGTYQIPSKDGWESKTVFVPFQFDAESRGISSLPVEESGREWRLVRSFSF